MSFLSDLIGYQKHNLGIMGGEIKDKPWRLLLGSADPASTKLWNGILGRDDDPMVTVWGGSPQENFESYEAGGGNAAPARGMDAIADSIAGYFAGGYGSGPAWR
jgi:hypothetical protein